MVLLAIRNTVIGLLLFCPLSLVADNAGTLKKLLAFQQYSASFSQTTLDQNNAQLQQLQGIIRLQKPDHFYWESNDPYPQKLISNGKLIWHYDADLEQVVIQQYAQQAERAPMLLVFRDAAALTDSFTLNKTEQKGDVQFFYLNAVDSDIALKHVVLGFSAGVLTQLRFIDNLQQTTDITFSDVVLNKPLDTAQFNFVIPPDADVLYE